MPQTRLQRQPHVVILDSSLEPVPVCSVGDGGHPARHHDVDPSTGTARDRPLEVVRDEVVGQLRMLRIKLHPDRVTPSSTLRHVVPRQRDRRAASRAANEKELHLAPLQES